MDAGDLQRRLAQVQSELAGLRGELERYRSFAEQSTEGIWCFDLTPPVPVDLPADEQVRRFYEAAEMTFCNRSMALMYGLAAPDEILGARLGDLLPPDDPDNVAYLRGFVESGHRLVDAETQERDRDGNRKDFLNNLVGIIKDGALTQVWGTQRDVTEHRDLENQLRHSQKMEAIGRLAGGVAHDFNNLLNIIMGYGSLLEKDLGAGHPGARRLEQVLKAAGRAAALTRQLLAFSRKQVLAPRRLELSGLVEEQSEMLGRLLGEDVELEADLQSRETVRVDPDQIAQVLMNLVVNARDAMPQGGRLTLRTRDLELDEAASHGHHGLEPGPYVVLSVSDTGTGIDAALQAQIFEPFFTTKEPGKGTGLGLSMVYGIVQDSGGVVAVESEPGEGSTFRVFLPRCAAAPETAPAAPEAAPPRGRETVLLVEDEAPLRALLAETLGALGYTVLLAAGPAEAEEVVRRREGPIHLLLTDVVMPGMDGRQLALRLTSLLPEMCVVYMTGYAEDALPPHDGEEPERVVLRKPFGAAELAERVRAVLDASEPGGAQP